VAEVIDLSECDLVGALTLFAKVSHAARLVLAYGKPAMWDEESFKGRRGKVHHCFANVGRIAMEGSGAVYVEGFVSVQGIPVEHAWLEWQGRLIDPTLPNGDGIEGYYGIAFATSYLAKTMAKTGIWGLISYTNHEIYTAEPETFLYHACAET